MSCKNDDRNKDQQDSQLSDRGHGCARLAGALSVVRFRLRSACLLGGARHAGIVRQKHSRFKADAITEGRRRILLDLWRPMGDTCRRRDDILVHRAWDSNPQGGFRGHRFEVDGFAQNR
jgi:hypothetical protein